MRLLNVKYLQFADFTNHTNRPRYVIASHRWAKDEVTYKDVQEGRNKDKAGYRKVREFAKYVKEQCLSVEWLWIDTCCINKDSDAELSYAINSMFAWYRDAELCIAYLADVGVGRRENGFEKSEWLKSEWFTRGWTLQELLAPRTVVFVAKDWQVIGNKGACFHSHDVLTTGTDLSKDIARATSLPEHVLNDWGKAVNIGIEEKMKWMNERATTRQEDLWYALFGIVGVSLPVIYGEGHARAKERLIGALRQKNEVATQHSNQYQEIKTWLSAPDPWTNHHSARKLYERKTGTWLLQSDEYLAWKAGSIEHLWIHGKAGCGKTILCSTAIEDIQTYCEDRVDIGQAIFYFSFSDSKKQTFDNLLCSLVAQLGWREPGLSMLCQAYNRPNRKTLGQDELLRILHACFSSYAYVFFHVDALDECTKGNGLRQNLLGQINMLLAQASNVHMLATSRDVPDVREFMDDLGGATIPIVARTVQNDIQQYISGQLSCQGKLSRLDAGMKTIIKETLARKADGMFRWVYCQLQQLNKSKSTKPSVMKKALDDLPTTLDETYERMLTALDEDDRPDAYTLLRWLAFAQRPLSLLELAEACTVDPTDDSSGTVKSEDCGSWSDTLYILAGLVVTMKDQNSLIPTDIDSGVIEEFTGDETVDQIEPGTLVRLAHFSVQVYLESSCILTSKAQSFHLDPAREQSFLKHSCLVYLMHYSNSPQKTLSASDLEAYPLLEYAAKWWWHHALLQESDDVDREMLFLKTEDYRDDWLAICAPDRYWLQPFTSNRNIPVTALYHASFTGLGKVAEGLLSSGADVNAQGGFYGNALQAASFEGHEKVVQMLLDAGADVNAQGGFHGNALQAASSRGNEKVVQILLEVGADVTAQGGHFGNALQAASFEGHKKVIQMLLDGGADVNAQGGHFENALQAASSRRDETVVRMLLDARADVNTQGGVYSDALQAASFEGRKNVVQMLLEGGADVNAQGGHFGNALQAASSMGHKKVVQMLLEAGADVNAQGGEFGNALQAASSRSDEKVVQMLLEFGADVNAQGGVYGNALHAASMESNEKVVQMLLEGGADINAQGGEFGNALQAASSRGHEKVVQVLLEGGADVNAQGGLYGNALQAASFEGHKKVMQMLLVARASAPDSGTDVER